MEIWGFGVDAGLNEFAETSRNDVPTSVHGHSNLQVRQHKGGNFSTVHHVFLSTCSHDLLFHNILRHLKFLSS